MIENKNILDDLLETYSSFIKIPICLVSSSGKILTKTVISQAVGMDNILSLVKLIKKPVISSLADDSKINLNNNMVISPLIQIEPEPCFLLVGPFENENSVNNHLGNDEKNSFLLKKIDKLHYLISNLLIEQENQFFRLKAEDMAKLFSFDKEEDETVHCFFKWMLQSNEVDFMGFAKKTHNDRFNIEITYGEIEQTLQHQSFFIGEGLLGQTAAMEKGMHWSNIGNSYRLDYFHRLGIYPSHLFAYPVKRRGNVVGLIFGGRLKEQPIKDMITEAVQYFTHFLSEKTEVLELTKKANLHNQNYYQLLDVMDICLHSQEPRNLLYKALDVLTNMSKGKYVSYTLNNGEHGFRGNENNELMLNHRSLVDQFMGQSKEQPSLSFSTYEHIFIEREGSVFGIISVECIDTDHVECKPLVQLLSKLLNLKYNQTKYHDSSDEETIQVMHESLREWNYIEYQTTLKAIELCKLFSEVLALNNEKKEELIGVCKIIPYSLNYLKGNEKLKGKLPLLTEYHKAVTEGMSRSSTKECKLLTLILLLVKGERLQTSLEYIEIEVGIKEKLENAYLQFTKTYNGNEPSRSKNIDININNEDIEKIRDVKSVIKQLPLTTREQEVLHLVLEGLNNQEVADLLIISVHTVKNHITNIFRKLNVTDRVQAMAKIYRIKYE
ncbi:helix-turn-helix transcriptional regulator [Bacillus sp. 31A1R]|uniref:Helix-turn-helix transcriptional regulator n=1 Tax=Robertmurraya mangrovi TaxID=3098077 RepID=A0ABU5J421_9BACI|nr:helix-turn-helix transcriptional regulator [Bacillus sp. 31A1R]MDZ5474115.1 helix-turn-helix transcriptional regulator [Bacillus sp. 31A1R]